MSRSRGVFRAWIKDNTDRIRGYCAYCKRPLFHSDDYPLAIASEYLYTKDHIYPRAYNKMFASLPSGINNMRVACRACNMLRASYNHCPAAMMIMVGVPGGPDSIRRACVIAKANRVAARELAFIAKQNDSQ